MASRPAPTRRLSKPTQYYMGEKINQGADLPIFSGTAPAANVQTFKPMDEAALPQAELFPRPPVEMRPAKRPTQTDTPAALLSVERIGE